MIKLSDRRGHEAGDCCSCGTSRHLLQAGEITRWEEHDDSDQPTGVVVEVCAMCVRLGIIEKHPRLYREIDPMEPLPGAMQLCTGCRWQETVGGIRCCNPAAKRNGGQGVLVTFEQPTTGIACGSGKGGRWSRRLVMWKAHPTACREREPVA